MKIRQPKLLVISVLISQLAGVIGSLATSPAIPTWYAQLTKPHFTPPNWLFGPVWLSLYTLMGVALYLVWQKESEPKKTRGKTSRRPKIQVAVKIFWLHLVVNSSWSLIFFGLKNLALAFLVIVLLWGMIVYLIRLFGQLDKKAAYLLLPYLLWVSFALMLNYSIWQLN